MLLSDGRSVGRDWITCTLKILHQFVAGLWVICGFTESSQNSIQKFTSGLLGKGECDGSGGITSVQKPEEKAGGQAIGFACSCGGGDEFVEDHGATGTMQQAAWGKSGSRLPQSKENLSIFRKLTSVDLGLGQPAAAFHSYSLLCEQGFIVSESFPLGYGKSVFETLLRTEPKTFFSTPS